MSRVVHAIQMAVMAFALVGEQACAAIGIQLPAEFVGQLREKRFAILMGAWFVGNMIFTNLTSTGAFEVLYDSDIIFSKMATGRMPHMAEILDGVQAAMAAAQ